MEQEMTVEQALKVLEMFLHKQCDLERTKFAYDANTVWKSVNMAYESLEQEPTLDKIRAEIVDTLYVDSLIFGELIDFKDGKISADDVIEEFNRVTRLEVLRIIDKYRNGGQK